MQDARIKIMQIIRELSVPEQIAVLEKVGMNIRKANSAQTAKEVSEWARKNGGRKEIDYTPILPK